MGNVSTLIYPFKKSKILFKGLNSIILIFGLFLLLFSILGEEPFLIVPSFVLLFLLVKWFAKEKYPAVIFFALLFQWIQISVKVLFATVTFQSLERLTDFPNQIVNAYLLSCLALFFVAIGIKQMLDKISYSEENIGAFLNSLNLKKALWGYLLFSIFATALNGLRFSLPGLFQAIVALGYVKWVLFFIVFYASYSQKKYLKLLWLIILIEFISGFVSYFSDFSAIIFMTLISYLVVNKIRGKGIVKLIFTLVFLIYVGLVWTAVKMDYRVYLNQGSRSQVVKVDSLDALNYLYNAIASTRGDEIIDAGEVLIDRISYIDYFSSCLDYVPKVLPHEHGLLTYNTLKNILVPRLFYSDKAAIDDSQHLTKYTGVFYANASMGVSFSLGYVGDLYIDYGFVFMFIALYFLGLFIGFIIRSIYYTSINDLWSMAVMLPLFLILYKFETALIKYITNLVVFWIVITLFNKFVALKIIRYIRK